MTATASFLNYIRTFGSVTPKQARTMFKVSNISDIVYRLRNEGHAIYTNRTTLADGRPTFEYRLGNPSSRYISQMRSRHVARARETLFRDALNSN